MAFFKRIASVTIGNPGDTGILVEDLRIRFLCKKTQSSNDPNTCMVSVYNLNPTRRNKINAGYEDASGLEEVFIGDVEEVNVRKEVPNVITEIEVSEGKKYITEDKTSLSFGAGTSVRQILEEIIGDAALSSNLKNFTFSDFTFNHGFHFAGDTKNVLDTLTQLVNISWSVQDNQIKFDKEAFLEFEATINLNTESGLIGYPERIKIDKVVKKGETKLNGWRIKSLLVPKAIPGASVIVSSKEIGNDKRFKVINVEHEGDTWEGVYQTTMEVIEL